MDLKQFSPLKVLNHWDTLNQILKGSNPPPISCEIDPTNYCNHNCRWCINDTYRKENLYSLSQDFLFRIIKELAEARVKSISFTGGGEPLLNKATVPTLLKVKEYGMEASVVSNGYLLSAKVSEIIVKTCSYLRISLDASTQEMHKLLHSPNDVGKDNLQVILNKIREIVKLKKKLRSDIAIGVGFLVFPENYHQIFDAAKLTKDIGVDYIQIRPGLIEKGIKFSDNVNIELNELILRALEINDENFSVLPIMHRFDEISKIDRAYSECMGHALVGVIGANMKMYLCCQTRNDPQLIIGDLSKNSFKEIWYGQQRIRVAKKIDLDECPPCRYTKYNEILSYLKSSNKKHVNFL